jgi:hypothetical protein
MRRILVFLFCGLLISMFSGVSFAEVYKWVDEKGSAHFTDDPTQVPEKYRPKTENMGISDEKSGDKEGAGQASKKKEDSYRDRSGRGEDYWKGAMEEWRKKLALFEEQIENLRMTYTGLTEKYNESRSTAERASLRNEREGLKAEMDRVKEQIDEAKNMIEKKIPEEAELYKAKPEWVK